MSNFTARDGGRIWTPNTFAQLVAIGARSRVGDRAILTSSNVEMVRRLVGATNKWVPVDPTWGTNESTTATVPFGVVDAEGIWTIDEDHYHLNDAKLNKSHDVLGVVFEATTGSNTTHPLDPTLIPAFLRIRGINMTRQDTANAVSFSFSGCGFDGAAADTAGVGAVAASQFSCCAGSGGSGGSATTVGLVGSSNGQYWNAGRIGTAAAGAIAGAGGNGVSAANIPPAAFERTNLGGHSLVGGGGAGGRSFGGAGGAGGAGGGCLIIHMAEIVSNATGISFLVAGDDGSPGDVNCGGGSGGGGGFLRLLYRTLTGVVSCLATGGAGGGTGGGGGNGGSGGDGLVVQRQI